MRAIDTFENLIHKVHEISANHYDETIPVKDMEFESLHTARIAGNRFTLLLCAQRLLANRLRVPYSYLNRCPANLQAENLNYWIQREAKKRDTFFCRFDGDKLRAVFTSRYTAIDHMEVLSYMLEYGFKPNTEVHYFLDQELMVLKVPDYERAFRLGKNDDLVPGVSFANSEVGVLAFSIEAYFYRLVCSNGMISTTSVASRFKHISRKALEQFPNILKGVIYQSEHDQERFVISAQTKVDNPLETIASFNRQFNITKKEAQAVKKGWEAEPGYTMFHVINAYTRGAQDPYLDAEESYKLEQMGGIVLSLVKQ